MVYLFIVLLATAALVGHGALWVSVINRLNSTGWRHLVLRRINRTALVCCGLVALGMIAWTVDVLARMGQSYSTHGNPPDLPYALLVRAYFTICWTMAGWASLVWIYRRVWHEHWDGVHVVHEELIDVTQLTSEDLAGKLQTRLSALLPGNQIFTLQVRYLELSLPRLPPALDGFSIVHLSDFHLAGHVGKPFHDEVVRQANELGGDLIVITGDILDRRKCLPWLESTIGKLKAPHGNCFIFGNHDHRGVPPDELRHVLNSLGMIDVGGSYHEFSAGDANVLLVGNELPWQRPPIELSKLPRQPRDADTLSIALSHSPDQISWASDGGFDLMLAGHLHGGQICLPIIGPVLSPSRFGVKYASGTFHRPPTVMCLTRGISGMMPLRFNCPPELTKLVLRPNPACRFQRDQRR